jgi:hypothetical protein
MALDPINHIRVRMSDQEITYTARSRQCQYNTTVQYPSAVHYSYHLSNQVQYSTVRQGAVVLRVQWWYLGNARGVLIDTDKLRYEYSNRNAITIPIVNLQLDDCLKQRPLGLIG